MLLKRLAKAVLYNNLIEGWIKFTMKNVSSRIVDKKDKVNLFEGTIWSDGEKGAKFNVRFIPISE